MKFNPDGNVIASGSHDKEIFLWYIHGECKNFMVMRGHKNAVLDLHWTTDGSQIISASPDKIVRVGCRGWKTDKEIGRTLLFCEFMLCCLSAGGLHLL
jgi:Prp8 binding protein